MEADDLLINENDPLEIKCTGHERISFIYPQDSRNAVSLYKIIDVIVPPLGTNFRVNAIALNYRKILNCLRHEML